VQSVIIDNHKTNILLTKKILNNWGAKAYEALDEQAGLQILELHNQINLVLIDTTMFPANNWNFLVETGKKYPQVKFIVLASNHKVQRVEGLVNEHYVLQRPAKQNNLYSVLDKLFPVERNQLSPKDEELVLQKIKDKRVLLVEDNIINQKIAEKMLTRIGLTIRIANNGSEALHMIMQEKEEFDLIFMDIQMPVMNGLDTTRELRQQNYKIPIVAMTANALQGDREICIDAGMNDYVGKPVKMNDLFAILSKWI
jgi:CheY-like chemotaxis protein